MEYSLGYAGSGLAFTNHGSTLQCISGIDGHALLASKAVNLDEKTGSSNAMQHHHPQQLQLQCLQLRQLPFKVR